MVMKYNQFKSLTALFCWCFPRGVRVWTPGRCVQPISNLCTRSAAVAALYLRMRRAR